MSIRKKIVYYFSVVTIILMGAAFIFIYTLFKSYREDEFHELQKESAESVIEVLKENNLQNNNAFERQDVHAVHNLDNEKVWVYDKDKSLLFSNSNDTSSLHLKFLRQLSPKRKWITGKDNQSDIAGIYMKTANGIYYAVHIGYDDIGYSKLNYLKYVLFFTFLGISFIIVCASYYLAKKISYSITDITLQVKNYDLESGYNPIATKESSNEVAMLTQRFNELMKRTCEAFSFQRHAVHHISHELKTPIAILVSNFEKIEHETDLEKIKKMMKNQEKETRNLSEIINTLLEIAKIESGTNLAESEIRIDELIFDLVDEFSLIHPDFCFSVEYIQSTGEEDELTIRANYQLLKSAFMNLMTNCIRFSNDNKAMIAIICNSNILQIDFINNGIIINENEQPYLFQHFFRGKNSQGKPGFGLGLVFVSRILALYKGSVRYAHKYPEANIFSIFLSLK